MGTATGYPEPLREKVSLATPWSSVFYEGSGRRESWADGTLFGLYEEGGAGRSVPAARKAGVCERHPALHMLSGLIYLDLR